MAIAVGVVAMVRRSLNGSWGASVETCADWARVAGAGESKRLEREPLLLEDGGKRPIDHAPPVGVTPTADA